MALHAANKQSDGYCYQCRKAVVPQKLKQCVKCKNWFCDDHLASVQDTDSIIDKLILLCGKDRGEPSLCGV